MAENVAPKSVNTASAQPLSMHSSRPSFASVAAMAAPAKQLNGLDKSTKADRLPLDHVAPTGLGPQKPTSPNDIRPALNDSLARLDIKDGQVPVPDVPDHELQAPLQIHPQLDDEKTHLSYSSTKTPSFDDKSVASTYAMDEKESIRPDDSASVKAADDDDSNSGPASGAPNSRVGSDSGRGAFNNQFHEISERMDPRMLRQLPGARRPLVNVAEELRRGPSASPLIVSSTGSSMPRPDSGIPIGSPSFSLPQTPDEKILEALESPKDRMFLLTLEQQVISFIKESSDPILALPPCNSFCRLLAHRLGDYYALGHVLDNSQSAVQLHRTPHCQLRPPLSSFETKSTPPSGPSATLPSMKIMRRREGNGSGTINSGTDTAENSGVPSKAGSEAGSESQRASGLTSPSESTSTKEKGTTREAREAAYKEARERIFAGVPESVEPTQVEATNDASRASSTSGKRKNKKKNTHDDSFDSRSAYNAYYPTAQRQGPVFDQSAATMNLYNPYMQQNSGQMYTGAYQQQYGQQYPQMQVQMQQMQMQPQQQMMQMPQMSGFQMPMQTQNQMTQIPATYTQSQPGMQQAQYMPYGQPTQQVSPYGGQPMQQSYYPSMQHPNQMAPSMPQSMPSPAGSNHSAQLSRPQSQMSDQSWSQGYQNPYQVYPPQNHQYPQGQYTGQPHQQMLQPMNQGTPQYPFGQLPYQQSTQPVGTTHPIPGSYNRQNSYGNSPGRAPMDPHAFRSASSNYHGGNMPNFAPQQRNFSPGQQFNPSFNSQHSSPRKPSGTPSQTQSPGQSTLSKWGTPSTLPPKPPPPASSNPTHLLASGTGGVPTYQNGTYSNPATDNKAPITS